MDVSETDVFRMLYGIAVAMASCHTAVEMPSITAGMDCRIGGPYDVLLVLPQSGCKVYAHYARLG